MRSGSSPSDSEAPEACGHAPSGSCPAAPGVWTLACSFCHRAWSTPSSASS